MKSSIRLLLALLFLLFCLCFAACQGQHPHAHAYGEWETTIPAGCTSEGMESAACTCGDTQTRVIAPTGHRYGEWTKTKAASCTEDGIETSSCICGDTQTRPIAATGHRYDRVVTTPVSCTEDGSVIAYCVCGDGQILSTAKAPGHRYERWVVTKQASCSTQGEMTAYCACGYGKKLPIASTGHQYTWTVMTPAGCITEGEDIGVCTCGDKTTRTVDPKGHQYTWRPVLPVTCTVDGSECGVCSCGDTKMRTITAPGHQYEWVTVQTLTCTADGIETGTCSCGDTKTLTATAPGHKHALSELDISADPSLPYAGTFTCEACDDSFIRTITHEDIGMPIVNISGSLDGISKENKVKVTFDYKSTDLNFTCMATLKVQGATSAAYPKKNFSVQFFKTDDKKYKVELVDGWGEESKYCMKANWSDFSQARNVVSAKLFGDISRTLQQDDEFSGLVNGGAIDGYPILVYHDGSFLGLYTMNIPKDKWMMGMEKDESLRQAIVGADDWHLSAALREPMSYDFTSTGWDLEYCSTEDDPLIGTDWAVDSFNEMMAFVQNNDGWMFREGIHEYINVERAMDTLLYTWVLCGWDNYSKNILWVTFDGKVWTPCVYDLDSTWGLWWNASKLNTPGEMPSFNGQYVCLLFKRLHDNFAPELYARYRELRDGVLSDEAIEKRFTDFFESIPDVVYAAEKERWPDRIGLWIDHETQILEFAKEHLSILDKKIKNNTW